jgi:putative peptide zinc metalloprotease protein
MTLSRKTLFITYAITSWLYRWFITFTILWFLYQFLRPYKLEVLSALLMMMACVTLFGMPAYRLIANIYRRGRLPDMKRWRVIMSSCVVLAVLGFVFFVPVRINKVTGIGVIQAKPEAIETLHTQIPGVLDRLFVREGDEVKKGEEIARFVDVKVEQALAKAKIDVETHKKFLGFLDQQHKTNTNSQVRRRLSLEMESTRSELNNAEQEVARQENIKNSLLVLRAPFEGRVVGVPTREAVGRMYDKNTPVCSVVKPDNLRLCLPVLPDEWQRLRYNTHVRGNLPVDIRIMGRGGDIWQGILLPLPESEAATVPVELSSRAGGPIAVKGGVTDAQVPQTQHYLVHVEILDPDHAMIPGQLAQAKVVCEPETCANWLWRKVNNLFDLKLW